MHPKFGLSTSVTVDALPQKRAVSDGRDHRMKPPINGRPRSSKSEGGSTVYQTWFIAAASLTLPKFQISPISVVDRVHDKAHRFKLSIIGRA